MHLAKELLIQQLHKKKYNAVPEAGTNPRNTEKRKAQRTQTVDAHPGHVSSGLVSPNFSTGQVQNFQGVQV